MASDNIKISYTTNAPRTQLSVFPDAALCQFVVQAPPGMQLGISVPPDCIIMESGQTQWTGQGVPTSGYVSFSVKKEYPSDQLDDAESRATASVRVWDMNDIRNSQTQDFTFGYYAPQRPFEAPHITAFASTTGAAIYQANTATTPRLPMPCSIYMVVETSKDEEDEGLVFSRVRVKFFDPNSPPQNPIVDPDTTVLGGTGPGQDEIVLQSRQTDLGTAYKCATIQAVKTGGPAKVLNAVVSLVGSSQPETLTIPLAFTNLPTRAPM